VLFANTIIIIVVIIIIVIIMQFLQASNVPNSMF